MRKTQLALALALPLAMTAFGIHGTEAVAGTGKGSVQGTAKLLGKAPEAKDLNMKSDPFCAKQPAQKDQELVVGKGGGLKNVVVRVTKGHAAKQPAPATEPVLDQNGCAYSPRVVVAQAGQTVVIKNSDKTLHNVHTYKGPATWFNQAQVQGMPDIKKKLPTAGDVVKFKCDVHPWMTAYVVVTDNPHFAVTGDDGSFKLENLPAGKYTIEAWHEKLGTKTQEITVADKPADAKFEFAAK